VQESIAEDVCVVLDMFQTWCIISAPGWLTQAAHEGFTQTGIPNRFGNTLDLQQAIFRSCFPHLHCDNLRHVSQSWPFILAHADVPAIVTWSSCCLVLIFHHKLLHICCLSSHTLCFSSDLQQSTSHSIRWRMLFLAVAPLSQRHEGKNNSSALCRFAVDRTPLQRMLVASVLHAQRGPDGGFLPRTSQASSPSLDPSGSTSAVSSYLKRNPGEVYASAQLQALEKLPDDLFDSPKVKPKPKFTRVEKPWHERCYAKAVSQEDTAAVNAFVDSFKTVCVLSSWAVVLMY
jgi:hypothetical protein